jgi:chemotaxis methyl-accepting protein methylase
MTDGLAQIRALVRQEAGVEISQQRSAALRAAMRRVAPSLDDHAFVAASALAGGRELIDQLIDEITIQESSFLRDRAQFDAIDWHGLRARSTSAGAGTVRVWSAGSARGEEAYTLALLAAEAFAPDPARVVVLGTDISRPATAAAQAGHYGRRAVRALSPLARERYFELQPDGTYLVGPELRAMVRFGRHNLARDAFPPDGQTLFDVIACRNVLIYLGAASADRVITGLELALRPGGVLLLGATDALHLGARARQAPAAERGSYAELPRTSRLRSPLGRELWPSREDRLASALDAAGQGRSDEAHAQVSALLAEDPMDAEIQFVQGLIALESGDPGAAAVALRRALYADNGFGLAAFTLGRAYDALGDRPAARRSYRRALRHLDPGSRHHDALLTNVDIGDIAAACRVRLAAPADTGRTP